MPAPAPTESGSAWPPVSTPFPSSSMGCCPRTWQLLVGLSTRQPNLASRGRSQLLSQPREPSSSLHWPKPRFNSRGDGRLPSAVALGCVLRSSWRGPVPVAREYGLRPHPPLCAPLRSPPAREPWRAMRGSRNRQVTLEGSRGTGPSPAAASIRKRPETLSRSFLRTLEVSLALAETQAEKTKPVCGK